MPEPKRPLKVFLCHARADRDAVRTLYTRLTKDGVDAWLDKEKLLPGQDWELEIRKAVREADVVVVCLSKQFNQAGFRQKEVRLALDTAMEQPEGEIFIIPVRLEECDSLENLRKWHWVDLFEDEGYGALLRSLRVRADKIGAVLQAKKDRVGGFPSPIAKKSVSKNPGFAEWIIRATVGFLILFVVFGRPLWGEWFVPAADGTTATATATSTFTPCVPNADILFNYVIKQSSRIASALGKQTRDHPRCIESSYQSFDGGEMIWRSDDPDIYILYANHDWSSYKNDFVFKNPTEVPCNAEPPPRDRFQPYLGFGKIWCDNQSVREKLGYATMGENQDDRAILTFENGWLMLISYTVRAVFHDGKQWESVDVFNFAQISLESRSDLDAKISNLGLEQERSITLPKASLKALDPVTGKLLAVPFRVGSKVSTQCNDRPEYPETIQIPTDISHPVRVYLLIQAGWGVRSYEYQTIGNITLRFDNGEPLDTSLILGYNIRDWADRPEAITTLVSRYTQTAWEGFDGVPGKIDILILDIPDSYASSTLKEIQIDDQSKKLDTHNMNPCIHLSAVTVSYLQLP